MMKTMNTSSIGLHIFRYLCFLKVLQISSAFTIPSPFHRLATFPLSLARDEYNRENDRYRTREVGQSAAERELRQLEYEQDYEYEYEDADYESRYEEEDDDEEDDRGAYTTRRRGSRRPNRVEDESVGNFWNNPIGGMDRYEDYDEDSAGRDRPRPRSRQRRNLSSRSNMPRNRESSRKTFRSGTPPPPAILKDFYDNLFWYGFDADETTSAADKTMFGGTRGKFSGLGLLQDSLEGDGTGSRGRSRRRSSREYVEDEYEDDGEYDEDYDDNGDVYYDYEYYDDEEIWDEDDDYTYKDDRDSFPAENVQPLREDRRIIPQIDDNMNERVVRRERIRREPAGPRSRRRPERREPERRTRSRKKKPTTTEWFQDEGNNEEPRGGLSQRNRKESETSPIINILDKVFQVDPDEVKYQAEDYDRRLGLGKKRGERSPRNRERSKSKPRKGYAYRYAEEDDDFMESVGTAGENNMKTGVKKDDDNIIDVEAKVQPIPQKKSSTDEDRKPRQQSWEDRASAYERVPPKGIKAWGPEGEINGGIDARSYAAQCALEEIEKMRDIFEGKEKLVADAEQDLLQLKREASIQKKKLLSENDRRYSTRIRDELRRINFDIEDSARNLRRAKGEALAAIDKLEDTELRHWALLRQHEADKELEKGTDLEIENGTTVKKPLEDSNTTVGEI